MIVPPSPDQCIVAPKYVLTINTLNFETIITFPTLTLKTPFKLCSKRFEKENLNINKDIQNSRNFLAQKVRQVNGDRPILCCSQLSLMIVPPSPDQCIVAPKYVLTINALNFETIITFPTLTLKIPFKLCSKRFEKENLNINKDIQNSRNFLAQKVRQVNGDRPILCCSQLSLMIVPPSPDQCIVAPKYVLTINALNFETIITFPTLTLMIPFK